MQTVERCQVRILMDKIKLEYGDEDIRETSARISRETGMSPGTLQAAYSRGGLSYPTYRGISLVLLGEDPGPPSKLHPEAAAIMKSHGWDMGGE